MRAFRHLSGAGLGEEALAPSSDLIAVPCRARPFCALLPGVPARIRRLSLPTLPEKHCGPHMELGTPGPAMNGSLALRSVGREA